MTDGGRHLRRTVDGFLGRALYDLDSRCGSSGEELSHQEQEILGAVDTFLERGRELLAWWRDASSRDAFDHRFELGRSLNEPDEGYGFFGHGEVAGVSMPLMGNFQAMFYDRPKTPAGESLAGSAGWMRDQMRQFALRYFMRVSDFETPEGYADTWRPPTSGLFEPLSWCPRPDSGLRGFGFQQLYYKRRGGEVGRFPEEERYAIVDLRELGESYEWIVVKVSIFDFTFTVAPFGPDFPKLVLPLAEESHLVLSRDFVVDEEAPRPGVLGRYGVGYSFIKNPAAGLLGYGPGEFDAAIETITFEVLEDGVVRVPMVFVANRPERIMNLRFDPVGWGMRLADLATFGAASTMLAPVRRALGGLPVPVVGFDPVYAYVDFASLVSGGLSKEALCITREQLDKEFLVKHYVQHYQAIAGSLATWRLIPDWLATDRLPEWVLRGEAP